MVQFQIDYNLNYFFIWYLKILIALHAKKTQCITLPMYEWNFHFKLICHNWYKFTKINGRFYLIGTASIKIILEIWNRQFCGNQMVRQLRDDSELSIIWLTQTHNFNTILLFMIDKVPIEPNRLYIQYVLVDVIASIVKYQLRAYCCSVPTMQQPYIHLQCNGIWLFAWDFTHKIRTICWNDINAINIYRVWYV